MCEDFKEDIIPVLAPPIDIRLEHKDSKTIYHQQWH